MKRFIYGLLIVALAVGGWFGERVARAGVTCTLPFNLQNNTTADATQVMANYNALVTCLGNAAAAGANSDITALLGLLTPISPSVGGSNVYIGGTSTGSANAQVVASTSPANFSLTKGYSVIFTAGFTNTATTGQTTLNVNSTGATNIVHPVPTGTEPLSGGEMVLGGLVQATYNGTSFELLNIANQEGGIGPSTSISSAATTSLASASNHNVIVTGTASITSFGVASINTPAYFVTFSGAATIVYNQTTCSTVGGCILTPGAANIVTAANDTAKLVYLSTSSGGAGNWQIASYQRANGTAVVNPTPLCGASGFVMDNNAGTPSSNVDITASSYSLINPTGNAPFFGTSLSATINFTNAGVVNGIDTGSLTGGPKWYNIFIISNGTTTGGLGSLSATAPLMPSGYTYRCRLGAILTDASNNFYRIHQVGNEAALKVTSATNTANLLKMATGTASATAVSLANFAPPTAAAVTLVLTTQTGNSSVSVAPNANYGTNLSTTNPPPFGFYSIAGTAAAAFQARIFLETANVYWTAGNAGDALWMYGWKDTVNAQ